MKFQNYILTVAILSLFACSNEDDPVKTTIIEPDATLSLVVDNDNATSLKKTKADINYDNLDKDIYSLTLAVFNQGAYENEEIGTLVAMKTAYHQDGRCENVEELEVHSGLVDVLILGNLSEDIQGKLVIGQTKLSDITSGVLFGGLTDEETKLTMGSAVHRVSIQSERGNCMGYDDRRITEKNQSGSKYQYVSIYQSDAQSKAIKLYRNVARIQLYSITLSPLNEYSKDAEFTLKSLFVANVKSKTRLSAIEEWGKVEWTTGGENLWLCGQFADIDGVLKDGEAEEYSNLFVQLKEKNASSNGKDYADDEVFLSGKEVTYNADRRESGVIGKTFYVYENSEADDNHTLLILHGIYKYTPQGKDVPVPVEGYYAVIVNKPGEGTLEGDSPDELTPYIKRNFHYSVNVTIKTPGAKDPYNPEINAYLSAAVKVEPWNVIRNHEDVE